MLKIQLPLDFGLFLDVEYIRHTEKQKIQIKNVSIQGFRIKIPVSERQLLIESVMDEIKFAKSDINKDLKGELSRDNAVVSHHVESENNI